MNKHVKMLVTFDRPQSCSVNKNTKPGNFFPVYPAIKFLNETKIKYSAPKDETFAAETLINFSHCIQNHVMSLCEMLINLCHGWQIIRNDSSWKKMLSNENDMDIEF